MAPPPPTPAMADQAAMAQQAQQMQLNNTLSQMNPQMAALLRQQLPQLR
jgi:hypothetical protein